MPLVCSFVFLCLIHFSYCTRLFTFHPLYRRSFTNVRQRGIFIFQFGFEYFLTTSRLFFAQVLPFYLFCSFSFLKTYYYYYQVCVPFLLNFFPSDIYSALSTIFYKRSHRKTPKAVFSHKTLLVLLGQIPEESQFVGSCGRLCTVLNIVLYFDI